MKNRIKKISSIIMKLLLVCVIFFAIGNVVYRKHEEKKFQEEMNKLINKNLTADTFNTPLKTDGTYKKIEKIIKNYLNMYSMKARKVLEIMNDEKLKSILSYENYIADGPLFTNTLEYLTTKKENFNKEIEELIILTKKENILKKIDKKYSPYYRNLYTQYMLGSDFQAEIEKSITELKLSRENINNLIDKEKKVIDFLVQCKEWTMKETKIMFYKQDDLNTYNTLIGEVARE